MCFLCRLESLAEINQQLEKAKQGKTMDKKYYTWDEIRRMPEGTAFRLAWNKDEILQLERKENGKVVLLTNQAPKLGLLPIILEKDIKFSLTLQDRFEVVQEEDEIIPNKSSANVSLSFQCSSCQNMVKNIKTVDNSLLCENCFDAKYGHESVKKSLEEKTLTAIKEIEEIFKKKEPSQEDESEENDEGNNWKKGKLFYSMPGLKFPSTKAFKKINEFLSKNPEKSIEDAFEFLKSEEKKGSQKEYVTMFDAVGKLLSHEWKKIALDAPSWTGATGGYIEIGPHPKYGFTTLICANGSFPLLDLDPLDHRFSKKWFRVE